VGALVVRPPRHDDAEAFVRAVRDSTDLHHPWVSPPSTAAAFRGYVDGVDHRRRSYLICEAEGAAEGSLVGVVNASEIVRGAFHSCYLGYYAFAGAAGRGLMTRGLGLVLDQLFDLEGLHRAEANIQPGNARSLALAARVGFTREGFSRDYLHIAGAWRDHERWAILATDPRPWAAPRPDAGT
jgi:ribosomal-protein-alanine N-acetyltransferase